MNQIARELSHFPGRSLIHFYTWPIEMVFEFQASMVSAILAIQQQWFRTNIRLGGTSKTLDKQTEGLQQATAASAQRTAASAQRQKSISRSVRTERKETRRVAHATHAMRPATRRAKGPQPNAKRQAKSGKRTNPRKRRAA